jgi:hypothetical protein
MEDQLPEKAKADLVGEYKPRRFSFGGFAKGRRPEDFQE